MSEYRLGIDVYRERAEPEGLELERPSIADMEMVGMPAVVACTGCTTTMVVLGALIDREGYTYCAGCAGVEEDEV